MGSINHITVPKINKKESFVCVIDSDKEMEYIQVLMNEQYKSNSKYVIIDAKIVLFYPNIVKKIKSNDNIYIFIIEAIESQKTIYKAIELFDKILSYNPSKDDLVLIIGGGVTLNLGGFVAGLLLRSVPFIHVPTTLLAQIDVFSGGKQAVNFKGYKNQLGFYLDPESVYINTEFLKTLTSMDFSSGLVEGIKLCAVYDRNLFHKYLEIVPSINPKSSVEMISILNDFITIKNIILEKDPYELGYGVGMVYGHTIGHAIEMCCEGHILHGVAVAFGMYYESIISEKLMISNEKISFYHKKLIELFNFDFDLVEKISINELMKHIIHDKKKYEKKIGFVNLKEIGGLGKCHDANYMYYLSIDEIYSLLKEYFLE